MSETTATLQHVRQERKRKGFIAELLTRLVKEKPLGTVGGAIVLTMFIVGITANFIAPYGMNQIILADKFQGPSLTHLLGTDNLGRDLLSRVIYGARISMIVGLAGASLSVFCSATIGITSGFLGGLYDLIVQRFVDSWMCLPELFVALTIMAILGPGLLQVILVLGISSSIGGSRVVRSAVMSVKENVYVEASRAIGASTPRILLLHIFPNVTPIVIIEFSIAMGQLILAEATLSFLGFGIPPPAPSWGGMLSGSGRQYMLLAPWMCLWPGVALSLVVYGINMLGDAIRDLVDPRLRGGLGRYGRAMDKAMKARMQNQGKSDQQNVL